MPSMLVVAAPIVVKAPEALSPPCVFRRASVVYRTDSCEQTVLKGLGRVTEGLEEAHREGTRSVKGGGRGA
eukprot:scaffold112884_cov51-Phaeocystis_antarctica.AAC.3